MRAIYIFMLLAFCCVARGQTVTSVTPNQAYQGQSLYTTISSSGLFMTGSSPQGNIQDILLKNANDSVFAISDSINVVDANTVTAFWNIPGNLASGLYSLVVRVYDNLFTGPTTDYSLSNAFTVTAPSATISGTVYDDLNHNGVKDGGEPGLPGYTIRLSPLGNIATSDASGNYTVSTVAGLDTVAIQVPVDDAYITSGATSHILTVSGGNTGGQNFGLFRDRYLVSMSPDSGSTGGFVTSTILSSRVFKNATVNSIVLQHASSGALIHFSSSTGIDTNRVSASFYTGGVQTGIYKLVVVVRSTLTNNLRTFTLDSAYHIYGPVGYISGYAFADSNSNGLKDPTDPGLAGKLVTIRNSLGTISSSTSTDSNGYYQFYTLPDGAYTVAIYNPSGYYGHCSNLTNFTTATTYNVTIARDTVRDKNYGIFGNTSPQSDLWIHPGWRPANPGFERTFWIFYGNYNGSVPATNTVITMVYDSTLTFDSCLITPTTHDLATHTLTWNVGTVTGNWIGGWGNFEIYFKVPVTAVSGQLLHDVFTISSTGNSDCYPPDNTVDNLSPVTSSMDPNEKHSIPYNGVVSGRDSVIDYTINFQNTGTASTHFVIVKDTLDTNLDFRSVEVMGSSSACKFDNNNGVLTFTMDPLVLTDSATDEPHSHGFVAFRVKVKTGTAIGTVIHNTANIYFDYNSAVNTNTAINTVTNPLGFGNMKDAMMVNVRPNPFEQSAIISFNNPSHDKYVLRIYDIAGNLVNTMTGSGSEFQIEKGNMASGVYMYKLTNQNTKLSAQGKVSVL
ncbi:MAG: putative rane-anchored cell surface protein [Bacteroidetes bacterium]|nr:putative rane-anchored cell surface protein [Bacteroidota bacterium]